MALQGQSHIKITADVNDAKAKLQQMQAQLRNTGKTADDVSSSIQGAFQKIGSAMAVGLSVAGLQQFTNQLIQTRGQFQQLEIAFGTMLGSTEKADALMKQLIQTAAKTPFDMQGIAQGAKQLLACGTAAEDVNDTIIKLGDIAAGLSLPLGDLVYLYGTTMTQGRMFTMDLRQMQGRGILIADEIAKIMNVSKEAVPEMVSAGKVTSEIFSQAVKNMASEGGKFYNLMEKQSSSLTGQISNLEDAIAQMFNEIGKASEDFLSGSISAVSYVVEHYKEFAIALGGVISAVGAYKASIIALNSINQAKQFIDNIRLVAMFRKELGLLKAAQQAFNITAMANPYVLLGAAIAGVVSALIGFTIATNSASGEQEKINDAIDKTNQKYNELRNNSISLLNTIRDENATSKEKYDAYEELKKAIPGIIDQYSLEELALIKVADANRIVKEAIEQRILAEKKSKVDKLQKAMDDAQKTGRVDENMVPEEYRDKFNMLQSGKTQINILQGIIDETNKDIRSTELSMMSLEERIKAVQDDIANAQIDKDNAKAELEKAQAEYDAIDKDTPLYIKKARKRNLAEAQKNYDDSIALLEKYKAEEKALLGQQPANQNLSEEQDKALKAIQESEKKLAGLRDGTTQSKNYKQDIETETKNLQELIKTYETLTGKKYKTTIVDASGREKQLEELKKLQQKATDEQYDYETKLIKDKYKLIDREEQKRLIAIDREEKEYNKKNGSTQASRDAFEARRQTVRFEAQFDRDQLDKEFKQWKDDFERSNNKIKFDIDMALLNQQLEMTTDVNEKLDIQRTIRQKLIDQQKEEIELEKQQAIKEKFGEQELKKYLAGTSTNAQVQEVAKGYDAKINLSTSLLETQNQVEAQAESLQRYQEYAQSVIDIEKWKDEQLAQIVGNSEWAKSERQRITEQADAQVAQSAKSLGFDAKTLDDAGKELANGMSSDVFSVIADIASSTWEQAQIYIDKVQSEIDKVRKQKEKEKETKQSALQDTYTQEETIQAEQVQIEQDLASGAIDEEVAKQKQIELENQHNLILQKRKELLNEIEGIDEDITKLNTTQTKLDQASANANRNAKSSKMSDAEKLETLTKAAEVAGDAISSVRDIFGDTLDANQSFALDMSQILVGAVSTAGSTIMTITTMVASGLTAMETASVILLIISTAIQLATQIANAIMKNFSAEAKQKAEMEEYNKRIDHLKAKHEEFKKSFENKTGTDYWQDMAKSVKKYAEEIRVAQEAQRDAEEFYERQKEKYGEDSKKAQEAQEQADEQKAVTQGIIDNSIEDAKELFEQMATTNVTSFGESMADALVEAFSQGLDGMNTAWEDTINDMIESMLTQRMALQLTDQFKDAFAQLESATSENSAGGAMITDSEMSTFLANMDSAKTGAMAIGEEYQKLFAEMGLLDDADIEAESKGFETMSQDTADELNGRFTALQISGAGIQMSAQGIATSVEDIARINMGIQGGVTELANNSSVALQIAQNQLNELCIISENTSMLTETNSRLKQIQDNTARL